MLCEGMSAGHWVKPRRDGARLSPGGAHPRSQRHPGRQRIGGSAERGAKCCAAQPADRSSSVPALSASAADVKRPCLRRWLRRRRRHPYAGERLFPIGQVGSMFTGSRPRF